MQIDAPIRNWITDNLARGCTAQSMVDAMVSAGHKRGYAEAAVAEVAVLARAGLAAAPVEAAGGLTPAGTGTVADYKAELQRDAAELAAERAKWTPVAVPEPIPSGSPTWIETSDRRIAVLAALRAPRVIVFGGVLSEEECDELVTMSRSKVARSLVVNPLTGEGSEHAERSSEGTFFYVNENPFIARLDRRIAELMRWPVENGEGLQILHYLKGGEYKPHYDYFDPNEAGSAPHIARGGNRVATLVIYLATSDEGGGTVFPDIGVEVAPIKGNAVFFSYDIPAPASLTLHGGAPVERGEKWIATKWVRSGPYR